MRQKVVGGARELGQLVVGAAVGLPAPFLRAVFLLSVPLLRPLADAERRGSSARLGEPVERPYRPLPSGVLPRARALLTDPATWRDLAWLASQFALGLVGLVAGAGLWLAALECVTAPLLRVLLPART